MHADGKGTLEKAGRTLLNDGHLDAAQLDTLTHQLDRQWQELGSRPARLPPNGLRGLEQKRTAHGITMLMASAIVPLSVLDLRAASALAGARSLECCGWF